MNASLFSTVARSVTLALTVLGLVAATVYQFIAHGTADSALLGVTTGFVGAFTGAHISGMGSDTNPPGQTDTTTTTPPPAPAPAPVVSTPPTFPTLTPGGGA